MTATKDVPDAGGRLDASPVAGPSPSGEASDRREIDAARFVTQTTDRWGFATGNVALRTHSPEKCAGRGCVVHAPTHHHMRAWPTLYRADRGLTERSCSHGVGHPDPDDVAWHVSEGREWQAVHGCDGCCLTPSP